MRQPIFINSKWPVALLFLALASGVYGQTAGTVADQAERIQRQQQERLERERRRLEEQKPRTVIERPLPPTAPQPTPNQPCREITAVQIDGASLLSEATKEKLVKPYANTCISVPDIERLMADITGLYIRRGYIAARAYIQAQDLSQGILRILIIEGRVEDIQLRDGDRDSINLGTAFPGVIGDPLNLRDFEQGLDQINRLQSNQAVLNMVPGEQPGSTVVEINNQVRRRVHATLSYDNHGLESTGEQQMALGLSLDNPLQLNDSLYLSYSQTIGDGDFDSRHSRAGSMFYSFPYGAFTFTTGFSRSDYATPVELPGITLISDGNQNNAFIATDFVAYRDAKSRLSLTSTLSSQRSQNYLAGQRLEVSSRRLSSFDFGVNGSTALAGGLVNAHVNHSWGLTLFNALDDVSGLPDDAPRAQYRKWNAGLGWQRAFRITGRLLSFRSNLEAQYADDVLYGSQQFSLGGLYSVRGFRNSTLAGDRGYYWRNELSLPMRARWFGQNLGLRPFIAYDTGEILNHHQVEGGHLAGAAVGVDISHRFLQLQVAGGKAVSTPDGLDDEGYEVFATLTILI